MFEDIKSGMTREFDTVVEERLCVRHTGNAVLSTPNMISLMERVALELIQERLPEGFTSVGYEVHVRHKAAALAGAPIKVWCKVLEVDGRKIRFEVRVTEGDKVIGEGMHRRTIIPMAG